MIKQNNLLVFFSGIAANAAKHAIITYTFRAKEETIDHNAPLNL